MSEVKYIKETDEFMIDGRIVKGKTLTESEKKKLKEQATEVNLLLDTPPKNTGALIL